MEKICAKMEIGKQQLKCWDQCSECADFELKIQRFLLRFKDGYCKCPFGSVTSSKDTFSTCQNCGQKAIL